MNNPKFHNNIYLHNEDSIEIPGPSQITNGDLGAGFYGEVESNEFIDGISLANEVNFHQGISQNNQTSWLKFSSKEKTLFIPKRPLRYQVSWEHIYQAGMVYGINDSGSYPYPTNSPVNQNIIVTIGNLDYIVRLLTGLNSDNGDINSHNESEWDRLIYRVHEDDGSWASYTDEDLTTSFTTGNGALSWTQETRTSDNYKMGRGNNGVLQTHWFSPTLVNSDNGGWRPVLELIL